MVDVFRPLGLAVSLDVGAARIHRPRIVRDLSTNQNWIARLSAAHGNFGLAFRKIEKPFGDNEIDVQTGITYLKCINQRRQQRIDQPFGASDPDSAGEPFVARGEVPLESGHGLFYLLGIRPQILPEGSKTIASRMALNKLVAKLPLKPREPPLDGGLAPAQGFGCRDRAARPCDREEIAQIIPVEHLPTLCISGG